MPSSPTVAVATDRHGATLRALAWAGLLMSVVLPACERDARSTEAGADLYLAAVAAFYTAIAAVQVGESGLAEERFRYVTQLYPEEPAAWANLGLVLLVRGDGRGAAEPLARAQTLAPQDARIQFLSGLASRAADEAGAEAVDLDPQNLQAQYLLTRFLSLPNPSARPAPPDTTLSFTIEPLATGGGPPRAVRALWLSEEAPLVLAALSGDSLWISSGGGFPALTFPFPGPPGGAPLPAAALAVVDYDYDFLMDLVLAGPEGLRLLRQETSGAFTDVTAAAIPAAASRGAYAGAWAADLDLDGDMDLVLAPLDGPTLALRNRGDGTFEAAPALFPGVRRPRDFVWADLDAEGTADAVVLDADGRLHVFLNRRSGEPQFAPQPLPATLGALRAVASADLNADGVPDLVVLDAQGTLTRLAWREDAWESEVLAHWPQFPAGDAGITRLLVQDFDNNGALDLVATVPGAAQVWLNTEHGFRPQQSLDVQVMDVADVSLDGRLDLLGVRADGGAVWLANRGSLDYYWVSMRPRAARARGDRRTNSFGIGGEIEIRAGLLYQKQRIQDPVTHFGLGEQAEVHVARVLWPHGGVQAEFNLDATNERLLAQQRLHGSCPWVFAYDGRRMQFVTDFIWRTALGLRINAQGTAGVIHSEDWIKIGGDHLAPRDGFYDVRITADLWETHFFDHVALMVVDHPAETEVFVDERFALPPPPLALRAMSPLRPVAGAWDHRGREVTALIRERDGRYLDTFELGPYQGIAEEHFVEVLLGEDVPSGVPLWLVASGWVYPTDSSINLAISQGDHPRPRGLRLEVPDGKGGWVVAEPDLGFPAGKTKTILVDLEKVFRPGAPRRLRLRTNLEIYWDRLAWAVGHPDAPLRTTRLPPAAADLRYRGFSAVHQAGRRAPELPDYSTIASTAPLWRDLEGFHTRFGDVLPLVDSIDGRYVIMNAGDELAFRFPEVPPPPRGWTRSFVLIGDGWVKDGNFNTGFSRTVLPLPYRGMTEYDLPPGRLEDDPAYRLHPDDWKHFHTRYVTPHAFHRALVPRPEDRRAPDPAPAMK